MGQGAVLVADVVQVEEPGTRNVRGQIFGQGARIQLVRRKRRSEITLVAGSGHYWYFFISRRAI